MKNFKQDGETVTGIAPYDVTSGGGVLIGALFGVAVASALTGAAVEIKRRGIFGLPKATGAAWTAWTTKVYWDNTNKVLTSTAASNTLVGVAAAAAASGDAVCDVLLTGQV